MSRSQGHYWLRHGFQPTSSTMFTKTQLYHLHRHFRHSGAAKMYELLRRTPEVDLPPNLFKMLQEIVEHCGSCQTFRSKEITFSSRLKGEAIFNRHEKLDLFYLDSKPVLHVSDKDTKFGAARFDACPTKNPTTAQIWEAFCKCWALVLLECRIF
jgi:hypothetical protein